MNKDYYDKMHLQFPLYCKDMKFSRGIKNKYCKKCKDGAFELLENKKQTGRCCRCGAKF